MKEKAEKEETEEKEATESTNEIDSDWSELEDDPIEGVESDHHVKAPAILEAPIPKKPAKSSSYSK